jgi:hypothetical protein
MPGAQLRRAQQALRNWVLTQRGLDSERSVIAHPSADCPGSVERQIGARGVTRRGAVCSPSRLVRAVRVDFASPVRPLVAEVDESLEVAERTVRAAAVGIVGGIIASVLVAGLGGDVGRQFQSCLARERSWITRIVFSASLFSSTISSTSVPSFFSSAMESFLTTASAAPPSVWPFGSHWPAW